ncbi:MAG: short-chain dehydrogenase, partial [Thermoanaerobaculia bacterium]
GFGREGTSATRFLYESTVGKLFMISPEKGADTLIWLATSNPDSDWIPGAFYVKRKRASTSPQAADAELARELWDRSEAAVRDVVSV